jgi:uncharacterized membrane protein (GlpM family)
MTESLVRFVLGGTLVAILPIIARRFGPDIAGLVLLFPAVSFAGLLFIGQSQGMSVVASTALSAIFLLPTVVAFLLTVHLAAQRNSSLAIALLAGTLSWFAVALPFVAWKRRSNP